MNHIVQEFAYMQQGDRYRVNHRHINGDNCELLVIISGDGTFLTGSNTYQLNGPSLVLIDAAFPHCITPQKPESYCRHKLILSKSYLLALCRAGGFPDIWDLLLRHSTGMCAYLSESETGQFNRLFRDMADVVNDESAVSKAEFAVLILSVLIEAYHIINKKNTDSDLPKNDKKIHDIASYICTHLSDSLSVDRIAGDFHFSKYYLCHLFHTETGMSIMSYIYTQRVSMSIRLLENEKLSISEIAFQSGFASSSHLCRHFKAYTGMTPSEYRRKIYKFK